MVIPCSSARAWAASTSADIRSHQLIQTPPVSSSPRTFEYTVERGWFESTVEEAGPCGPGFDPVDQVMTLWTNKTGLQGVLGGKRSRLHWMSEDPMPLQLDPLDHHFDPEGQAPALWVRTN
jgi:hypothetical protein